MESVTKILRVFSVLDKIDEVGARKMLLWFIIQLWVGTICMKLWRYFSYTVSISFTQPLLHPHCVLHRVSKKLCKLIFCQNFAKFRRIVNIFGTKIAERTGFSEVYSFSTSPNLCQHTTVWNADVQNCYITLWLLVCSKLSNDLISTQ